MGTLTFRQPRLVALFLLVVLSAGASALLVIGRQEDPDDHQHLRHRHDGPIPEPSRPASRAW